LHSPYNTASRAQFEPAAALDPNEEFYRAQLEKLKQP
jgi:hypothetical protein